MKRLTKNIIIYSLVGVLQFGIGAATLEASPRQDGPAPDQRYEDRAHPNAQRDRDRDHRMQQENERHEREMIRREHESEHEWQKRQRLENERHDKALETLAGVALLYMLINQ